MTLLNVDLLLYYSGTKCMLRLSSHMADHHLSLHSINWSRNGRQVGYQLHPLGQQWHNMRGISGTCMGQQWHVSRGISGWAYMQHIKQNIGLLLTATATYLSDIAAARVHANKQVIHNTQSLWNRSDIRLP